MSTPDAGAEAAGTAGGTAPGGAPRVLVLTVVHNPQDARILHRQIAALVRAGFAVTYAAPFSGYGIPRADRPSSVATLDVPRATGRRRLAALRGARAVLAGARGRVALVLLHDPELLAAAAGLDLPPVVWDVHEDTAGALTTKPWLPAPARRPVGLAFLGVERLAERRHHLTLAEYGYAGRFARPHPVVPNTTVVPAAVPPPGADRVVHLGHLRADRGAAEMLAAGRELRRRTGGAVTVHLIGPADAASTPAVRAAADAGDVVWHGFVPNTAALPMLDGALAGMQLLHDLPNHRASVPTKTMEYLAHGVPVVASPLPHVARLLAASGGGVTVPFGSPEQVGRAVAEVVLGWREDPGTRRAVAAAGHAYARERLDWSVHAVAFTDLLRRWAAVRAAR